MENQNDIASASTNQVVRQVMNYWADRNKAVTDYFNKYADDFYYQEVAPRAARRGDAPCQSNTIRENSDCRDPRPRVLLSRSQDPT